MRCWMIGLVVMLGGCASEDSLTTLPEWEPPVLEVAPECPTDEVHAVATSQIVQPVAHCASNLNQIQLGIRAVDVAAYDIRGLVYIVDTGEEGGVDEEWTLPVNMLSTPSSPNAECNDVSYWERLASAVGEVRFPENPPSAFACEEHHDTASLTYAFALVDSDDEVVDCMVLGHDPTALRERAAEGYGPSFPVHACTGGVFDSVLRE